MLTNKEINIAALRKISKALSGLKEPIVFVGGAVVCLYTNNNSGDIRPTKDVDITTEVYSLGHLESLREEICKRGFYQSIEDNVICRFRYEDIKIDIMSTKAVGWAPANEWFEDGFKNLISFELDDTVINCLSLPYFTATKFSAFYDRGSKDPRFSHDFEDIVYLMNYVSDFENLIKNTDDKVKKYLIECFSEVLRDDSKQEAILCNLPYDNQVNLYNSIVTKLKRICNC